MDDSEYTPDAATLHSITARSANLPVKLVIITNPPANSEIIRAFSGAYSTTWKTTIFLDYEAVEQRMLAEGFTGDHTLSSHGLGKTVYGERRLQALTSLVDRPVVKLMADTSPKAVAEARRKALLGKRGRY